MTNNTTKIPIRKKAVETRKKLIETSIEVIAEKGYHNVTMDEIAKSAGMSTGIAYRYFNNKKSLLLAAIEYYFANIEEFAGIDMEVLLAIPAAKDQMRYVLKQFYLIHRRYYGIHEELESLRHIDEDVKKLYIKIQESVIDMLIEHLPLEYREMPNIREKLYMGLCLLENFAHMQMDSEFYPDINMVVMEDIAVQSVINIFWEEQ